MSAFRIELPMPPSVNALFRNVPGRGRVKTKAYKAWRDAAIKSIWWQVKPTERVGGKISVMILLPEATRMDIDNAVKPLLDALVASGRVDDDRNVMVLNVHKCRAEPTCAVAVTAAGGGYRVAA